jgi:hypothetical protein
MMPEIPEVARTVVWCAAAVGIGFGDAPERACPACCFAQPLADTAAASRVTSNRDGVRIALTGYCCCELWSRSLRIASSLACSFWL